MRRAFLTSYSGKHPEYAIQHVVLSGGKEHEDIFRHYQQAVDEIVKFIYRALGVPEPSREQSNSLFIGRRVFTKVGVTFGLFHFC
jgi:hypothetical protein